MTDTIVSRPNRRIVSMTRPAPRTLEARPSGNHAQAFAADDNPPVAVFLSSEGASPSGQKHPVHGRARTGFARLVIGMLSCFLTSTALANPVFFSNGNVDGRMAMASRPSTAGSLEIETADDFVVTSQTRFTHATFTGLLTGGATTANISQVAAEIYRVFPKDSNTTRTPGVPTRVNSPSDVEFIGRNSTAGQLNFTASVLGNAFTALNSVQAGGIHPIPNQTTGGDGPIAGIEVLIDIVFSTSIDLDPDHYFFVPQVALSGGEFLWLSSARPIVAPGTPFAPDLQAWTRDQFLDPDWLRVGTDIVGGNPSPTFNAAFSLDGQTIPEPSTIVLVSLAFLLLGLRKRFQSAAFV